MTKEENARHMASTLNGIVFRLTGVHHKGDSPTFSIAELISEAECALDDFSSIYDQDEEKL